MPSVLPSSAPIHRTDTDQRPRRNSEERIRNHIQSFSAAMEAAHGFTDFHALRKVIGKFRDDLTQEDTWDCVQHLFTPDADKEKILKAIARCHVASFEPGNEYLCSRKGQAHIDGPTGYLLRKLTSEARDSMLKDLPVLTRGPNLVENASLQSIDLPPVVLTLSEIGLRLPLDRRHAGDDSGDGGLRQHETNQLLARIQKEAPQQVEIEPEGMHSQPALNEPYTHTDHWLTERLQKFQPTFSAQRDVAFSLNGEVEIDGHTIFCRHIARLWEEDFLHTAGKPSYQALNSPTALQESARPLIQTDSSKLLETPDERIRGTRYWMSNDWGEVLTENFHAMARQAPRYGAVCRTLYLMTPNHAMVFGLKIKDRAGARRYVVQLYDPNRTVAHQRSAITAKPDQAVPAEIRILKPGDFLSEDFQKHYLLVDAENRSIPTLFYGEKMEPGVSRFAGNPPDLDGQVMRSILIYNLPDQLHAHADQLKSIDAITRMKILTNTGHADSPGLSLALAHGHAEVLEALGEILKACQPPLSPAQLEVLLSARDSDGDPGLYSALRVGNTDTVEAFGGLLKACAPPLSPEQLMNLLAAKTSQGVPGLYAALHNRHEKTIKVFGELLKTYQQSLSAAQLMDLLSAKNGTESGLNVALEMGHTATIEAFAEILKTSASRLAPEQFLELLLVRLPDGCPALYDALERGDTKWIQAYGKLLESVSPSVPSRQLAKILAAKSSFGRSALRSARKNGHVEATAAFEVLRAKFAPRTSARQRMGQAVRLRVRKWILKLSTVWSTKK